MRLLLDENYPLDAALGLANAGHDVCRIAQVAPGLSDQDVLVLARREFRILLTFDVDFGELVFFQREPPPPGIVLLRLDPITIGAVVAASLKALEADPLGALIVEKATAFADGPSVSRRHVSSTDNPVPLSSIAALGLLPAPMRRTGRCGSWRSRGMRRTKTATAPTKRVSTNIS